jgi:hypothetical protein
MADRYEIREEIGKGGLGAVYRAFDTQLQRDVAMKRVLTTDQGSQEEVQKAADNLLAEAQTLSTLNHPNIVTVFDVGQDAKGGFVVMELLNGETLDDTVARGVLTQDDFIEVVSQTMEALIAAQAANVLHRDLKPTNVMVIWQASGKFQTKILDFGLAKLTKTPSVQTMDQDDAVMGSIYFMAPEQFERGELDERTDMYAIGCVYYFALTGQYPFRGETAPQVMNAHLQHRVTSLEKLRPDLSPSICQWVMWLINRKMENRPASAREAMERFPQNPEPPGQAQEEVLQAIPVEEAPHGATTGVHVVAAPVAGAAPPSSMVITHHPDGSVSQQLAGAPPAPQPKRKALKILLAISMVVLLGLVGVIVSKKMTATKEAARLATLAGSKDPEGTVDDIDLAMKYLIDRKGQYGLEQKGQARDILMTLKGDGIEAELIDLLSSGGAPTSASRMYISQSLAGRDSKKAVPAMLNLVNGAASEPEKKVILSAVRGIATDEHTDAVLQALGGNHSAEVRAMFENILLAIFARKPRDEANIGPLLSRVSTTSGDERRSLFRVLGTLGGDLVLTRLKSIFSDSGAKADQYDAMTGLLNWQDRGVVPILDEIIENTDDRALKAAAARALARVVSLPAPGKPEELVATWKRALDLTEKGTDAQRIFTAVVDMPTPESRQFVADLKKEPKFKTMAGQFEGLLNEVAGKAKDLSPSELLPAVGADQVRGEMGGVDFDEETDAFVNWRLPETWFSFHLKVREAGTYDVEVMQSYITEGASQFQVILGDKSAIAKARATNVWEEYKPVRVELGVALEPGKIYTVYLRAKGTTQPRMMNVKGIKLVKR